MPLTPYHLLYTYVGTELPDRVNLTVDTTVRIKKILAERAFRWIYARRSMEEIALYRPRTVNPTMFKEDEEQLRKWHIEQSKAENQE